MKILILFTLFFNILIAKEFFYYKNNKKILLQSTNVNTRSSTNYTFDYYKNKQGITLAVNNRLILKLKENTNLNKYLNEFKMIKIKKLRSNTYLLEVQNKSLTLETSSELSLRKDVLYSHPDFIKVRDKR